MANLLHEDYPELFHYTGINGLAGIIKSQTLWATHPLFMNDTTELIQFKVRFHDILQPVVNNFISEMDKTPASRTAMNKRGGNKKVLAEINGFIEDMYEFTFLGTQHERAFAEPFVVSFCTTDNIEVKQHGLLSQWRGYGQEGGYAIEFDTELLSKLLIQEAEKWQPGYDLFAGNVVYSNEADKKISEEFGEDIKKMSSHFRTFLGNGDQESLGAIYNSLVKCACRYKHWGFHEEKEVRIIAIPPNKDVFQLLVDERKAKGLITERVERRHFVRMGTPVPCIHLLDGITHLPDSPLPITRIIVGPHRDKQKRKHAVESLLSRYQLNIPVTVSEIPYVGNY